MPTLRVAILFLLLGLAAFAGAAPAAAAPAPAPAPPAGAAPPTVAALAAEVDKADAQAQAISAGARLRTIDDASLRARLAAIPAIQNRLDDALSSLEPRFQAADARLAQLGTPPAPGQAGEDPEITQERQRILAFRRALDTEIKQAHLIGIEVQQLADYLGQRRRELFSEHLWQRDRSPFDYRFWGEAAAAWPADQAALAAPASASGKPLPPLVAALWLAVAAAAAGAAWLLLDRWALALAARRGAPTRLARSLLALGRVVAAFVAGLIGCLLLHAGIDAARPALVAGLMPTLLFAAVFAGLGNALLAPRRADWRLAPLPDALVDRVAHFPAAVALVTGASGCLIGVATAAGVGTATMAVLRGTSNIVVLATIAVALRAVARAARAGETAAAAPADRRGAALPWAIALFAAGVALAAALVATLIGYLALGGFVIGETVWIATVLAMLFLLIGTADELFPALVAPSGHVGRLLHQALNLSVSTLRQGGVLAAGFARVALLLFGWTAVLAPFGASADDLFGRLTASDLVFHFGQVDISPGTILIGFLVFAAGLAVTRGVRGWLETRYLPTTAMDLGAQSALGVGVTYLGALVAIAVASAYLGLSLNRIALLASALSVGIGFGLQSIISNFVSGLILLAERPVKVGDWIAIGDLEGDVRKISVRATEIEMRDRSKLIVPNSDLISKTVRNVTRGSSLGRVKIVLLVADETDPQALRDLVMARLAAHQEILADPAANLFFTDIRDGALEFTALAYVATAREAYRIKSELLFEIVPALKQARIALASTSPVVHVGLGDRAIEPAAADRGAAPTG